MPRYNGVGQACRLSFRVDLPKRFPLHVFRQGLQVSAHVQFPPVMRKRYSCQSGCRCGDSPGVAILRRDLPPSIAWHSQRGRGDPLGLPQRRRVRARIPLTGQTLENPLYQVLTVHPSATKNEPGPVHLLQ